MVLSQLLRPLSKREIGCGDQSWLCTFWIPILSWRKNQVVGADIDMAQAIADELGVKLEISSMSFDNVLTSLQTGKADLAVAGISATDEEKRSLWFFNPLLWKQD